MCLRRGILLVSVPTFILQNMFQSFFVTAEKPNLGFAVTVGYHYGARNRSEVHNLYSMSLRLIGEMAVVLTIGAMFLIPQVARFFVGYDPELLVLTTRAFRLYGLSFLVMGYNIYASSFFTALGGRHHQRFDFFFAHAAVSGGSGSGAAGAFGHRRRLAGCHGSRAGILGG